MTGFRAVEDRPTPKEVYNPRLYAEAAIIATGSLLFGYDSAFVGTTIARASFKADFGIDADNSADISSNITSAFQLGAFVGAIICFLSKGETGMCLWKERLSGCSYGTGWPQVGSPVECRSFPCRCRHHDCRDGAVVSYL